LILLAKLSTQDLIYSKVKDIEKVVSANYAQR